MYICMYPFCVLPYSTLSIPNLLEHILKNEKKIIFSLYYVSVAKMECLFINI